MILVISTSSPVTSIALIEHDAIIFADELNAPRAASGAVIQLVQRADVDFRKLNGIAVDVGPGSFTGVRVGVTMAKIWSAQHQLPLFGISAFDLVSTTQPVAITSKRNEVFYRDLDGLTRVLSVSEVPAGTVGSGLGGKHPCAANAISCQNRWQESDAYTLVPFYLAEPAISQAKQQHIMGETLRDV
ncbi:tRNA (adenosine(37)-N6)-threonylcarbamoyltransferase complex dimerization subunit type 1 TsaB [Kamptonema cortianum]|nr:tRNA (adenosine(37)-N6)-threonylcarbamoyltransferase complex dimerization subunit type 1 TsaB [Geitlerinema splendidum]MDK3158579.1 tRNA (adenosine(37)-N6)-threonylcarbamoyltransferase complex dimerization subunit type 1 TsaB [Kamptonema cortianum]